MNTPSALGRLPTVIVLLVVALGVPGAAAWAFSEQVTQHPWQALGLAAVYEVLVLFGGTVTKIWGGLQSRWVDRLTDKIDNAVMGMAPGYERRYKEHLKYRHRNFDVKGLSTQGTYALDLERVFVDLRIVPRPAQQISGAPLEAIPEALQGRHSIWEYARNGDLQHLAIIGAPGSGKTTLLKHITLLLTKPGLVKERFRFRHQLPILLFLRDHSSAILSEPSYSLEQAIRDNLAQRGGPVPPAGWFSKQCRAGRSLVMLDGLDEVADYSTRSKVLEWTESQVGSFPRCKFIITSRPHGYRDNPMDAFNVLAIQPFDYKQVEQFVTNWYMANEIMSRAGRRDKGIEMEAHAGAKDLMKRLTNSTTLSELAVNPLLLTMIATVHRYRSSLPGRRVELYAEVFEVFLGKRQQSKGLVDRLTPFQKQRVLQPLAYSLMQRQRREISTEDAMTVISDILERVLGHGELADAKAFLESIENESGLLVEREIGEYSFSHLAFQEFLAAVHIREQRLESMLISNVANGWWHETIRLYCAQADATPIVSSCLQMTPLNPSVVVLAIECAEEAKELSPDLRLQLNEILTKWAEEDVE